MLLPSPLFNSWCILVWMDGGRLMPNIRSCWFMSVSALTSSPAYLTGKCCLPGFPLLGKYISKLALWCCLTCLHCWPNTYMCIYKEARWFFLTSFCWGWMGDNGPSVNTGSSWCLQCKVLAVLSQDSPQGRPGWRLQVLPLPAVLPNRTQRQSSTSWLTGWWCITILLVLAGSLTGPVSWCWLPNRINIVFCLCWLPHRTNSGFIPNGWQLTSGCLSCAKALQEPTTLSSSVYSSLHQVRLLCNMVSLQEACCPEANCIYCFCPWTLSELNQNFLPKFILFYTSKNEVVSRKSQRFFAAAIPAAFIRCVCSATRLFALRAALEQTAYVAFVLGYFQKSMQLFFICK